MQRLTRATALFLFVLPSLFAQNIYKFSSPDHQHSYRLAADEVYVKSGRGALVRAERSKIPAGAIAAPVFYDLAELPASSRLNAMTEKQRSSALEAARRVATEKLLIEAPADGNWNAVDATTPVSRIESDIKGWWLVEYTTPEVAIAAARKLQAAEPPVALTPVFSRKFYARQALQRTVNDPLYTKQWHLTEEKVSVRPGNVWDTVTGKGINIVVVDDGLDVKHEDLAPNAFPVEGNFHANFNEGPSNDPSPLKADESHGTACAGLAAARGFNNIGVVGVAPEARLMGVRLIAGDAPEDATGKALTWQPNDVVSHISSNSWGPADDGAHPGRMSALQAAALEKGATTGRDGLGTVYVISAGNGRDDKDNSSYDEFSSSRFAIGVGAVNREGKQSSYSESGMNVAVSAFGGEYLPPDVTWTTGVTGQAALDEVKKKYETSTAPVNYHDAFNGTSAAAPQVSGTVALMLERNPKLGYRDVKEILMKTARRDNLVEGDEFATNTGGFTFSHSFGAGVVDVKAAVTAAADWKNLGPVETQFAAIENVDARIPDADITGVTAEFDFTAVPRLRVEHVELIADVEHPYRGDIGFVITSPNGMRSVAEPRPNDKVENFEKYRFTSVRHWGESNSGVWKVRVVDTAEGDRGSLKGLTLRIYGTAAQ